MTAFKSPPKHCDLSFSPTEDRRNLRRATQRPSRESTSFSIVISVRRRTTRRTPFDRPQQMPKRGLEREEVTWALRGAMRVAEGRQSKRPTRARLTGSTCLIVTALDQIEQGSSGRSPSLRIVALAPPFPTRFEGRSAGVYRRTVMALACSGRHPVLG